MSMEPVPESSRHELLEMYGISVEMADRISARRGTANAFFVSLETALATVLALFVPRGQELPKVGVLVVAIVGVMLSAVWWMQLRSYRDLNRAKFIGILDIERQLLVQPFAKEWEELQTDHIKGWRGRYAELGTSERVVPILFAVLYIAILVYTLVT